MCTPAYARYPFTAGWTGGGGGRQGKKIGQYPSASGGARTHDPWIMSPMHKPLHHQAPHIHTYIHTYIHTTPTNSELWPPVLLAPELHRVQTTWRLPHACTVMSGHPQYQDVGRGTGVAATPWEPEEGIKVVYLYSL